MFFLFELVSLAVELVEIVFYPHQILTWWASAGHDCHSALRKHIFQFILRAHGAPLHRSQVAQVGASVQIVRISGAIVDGRYGITASGGHAPPRMRHVGTVYEDISVCRDSSQVLHAVLIVEFSKLGFGQVIFWRDGRAILL